MHSALERVIISTILIANALVMLAQADVPASEGDYLKIYEATARALANDPLLQNGIYYAYPYYSAVGHPFFGDGEFEAGAITFREKRYEGVIFNYDVFHQQIILSKKMDGILQMNLLANEFLSAFSLMGKHFIKASFPGGSSSFFQVIAETKSMACYYSWDKERREILDSGNQRIYSFSEEKRKSYLFIDAELKQYKNNRSFVQLLPENAREEVKLYLKGKRIQVKEADDQAMRFLIAYCQTMLER
jgi:hypothetical protein